MINLLGTIGLIALLVSGLPQLLKTLKEGHARGVAIGFLITMNIGFLGMFFYTVLKYGDSELLLATDYAFQFVVWMTVLKYKLYPRD